MTKRFLTESLQSLSKVSELIDDFKAQTTGDKNYVFNSMLDVFVNEEDFSEVKYIVLGDFPGETERLRNKYFAGETGVELLKKLEDALLSSYSSKEKKFLILNKSPYTCLERDLILEDPYAKESQEYMASLVYHVYKKLNDPEKSKDGVPIWIFGDDYTKLFRYFFTKLSELFAASNDEAVYVFSHPLYGNLYEIIPEGQTIVDIKHIALQQWKDLKLELMSM